VFFVNLELQEKKDTLPVNALSSSRRSDGREREEEERKTRAAREVKMAFIVDR